MKLGLVAYLTFVFNTANAGPVALSQLRNDDLEAHVHSIQTVRPDEIALEIDGAQLITPWQVKPWIGVDGAIAIAVLVQGEEHWIGTDQISATHIERAAGALPTLATALDELNFHDVVPPRSTWRVGMYADKLYWTKHDLLAGDALGTQRDYFGREGHDLSQALRGAASALRNVRLGPDERRVILVLGDGCDDASRDDRAAVRDLLATNDIELHAVMYRARTSCNEPAISQLTSNVTQVNTLEKLASTAHAILAHLDDRTVVRFDASKLPWDGEPHTYRILAGEHRLGPVFRTLEDRRSTCGWWWVALAGGGLATLLLAIRRWYRSSVSILR